MSEAAEGLEAPRGARRTSTTGDEAKPVREEDAFDVEAAAAWVRQFEPELVGTPEVRQFPGGASNLTYLLRWPAEDLILRRPPSGQKARGAHDMGREFTVQSALAPLFPYVPRMVGHCTDETVIGSEFYVMERVEGTILRRDLTEPMSPEQASRLCESAFGVLVDLHSVDVTASPELAAMSRGEGYVGRQVSGWTHRFEKAATDDLGDWTDIVAWITERQPTDVGQVLIHNDFRLDNMVLASAIDGDLGVVALLDWEMATVGDPLMDLGGAMAYWVEAGDDDFFQAFKRQPSSTPGMWTRQQVVDHYCAAMGYSVTPEQWRFYEVFGLFRLAVIAQQIWYRYFHGQTHNEAYAVFGPAVGYLEQRCRSLID